MEENETNMSEADSFDSENFNLLLHNWKKFLSCCTTYENVRIVCSDGVYTTHKLLLVHTHFLKYLISQGDVEDVSVIIVPDYSINQVQAAILPFKHHLAHSQIIGHENKDSENLQNKLEDRNAVLNKADIDNLFDLLCNTKPETSETEKQNLKYDKETRSEVKTSLKDKLKPKRGRKRIKVENEMKDFIVESDSEGNALNDLMENIFNDEETEDIKEKPKPKKARKNNTSFKHIKKDLEGLISCNMCGQCYSDQKYLDAHITKKHPEKSNLADFIKQQNSGYFKCQLCDKEFSNSRRLRYHLKIKHKIGAKFSCDICLKRFYYDYELESHRKYHYVDREYSCDLCNKKFFDKKSLEQHNSNMHSTREEKEKNRKFVCSRCGKGFFSKSALQEHEFLHSDTKQFNCNICGKLFRQASGLRAHNNRYHSGSGPKTNTEEQKEKMRVYMKKYRAMKLGKIPDVINHRFSNHPGSELEGECVDDPDQHHHQHMHNNINKTAQSVYLTQEELVTITGPEQYIIPHHVQD